MAEPSSKEFYDVVTEIKVELGVINTKVDYLNEVRHLAEQAKATAEEAKQLSMDNKEDIRDMKANTKWVWGVMLTVIGLIVTVAIAVFR